MSNEITKGNPLNLPERTQDELLKISKSPKQYYAELTPVKATDPLTDSTPTLSQIHRRLGTPLAMMAVSESLMELKAWFNVKMNLNPDQIAMIAEMILEVHWDLSLNDIKAVFREKMCNAKLYGKLDGSDIMGWLDEHKQRCITAKQGALESEGKDYMQSPEAVSYEEWSKHIPEDENYIAKGFRSVPVVTPEQQRQKDLDFFKWKTEYLKSKGITPK